MKYFPERATGARLIGFAVAMFLALTTTSMADELVKLKVGVLRFSSSGPVFIAKDEGYFRDAGLDVEIVYFQAAPTVAAAAASGEITFGVTALTAAAYNLADAGKLTILAGQAQEKSGHPGNLVLVNRKAFEGGIDAIKKIFAEPFGLTQLGSPSHYQAARLAQSQEIAEDDLHIRAFQNLPNLVAALKSGQVTWAIIAPPIATDLIDAGAVVSLGPYSDYGSFQFGALFTSSALLADGPNVVRGFVDAYQKGLEDYSAIVLEPKSPGTPKAARTVGRYVYPELDPETAAGKIMASALYVDPTGRLDVEDIARQLEWYKANGLLKHVPPTDHIIDMRYLK